MPIEPYLQSHFAHTRQSVATLSNGLCDTSVAHNKVMYSFDAISSSFFSQNHKPKTADALVVCANTLYFIEFKRGFFRKTTRENCDDSKFLCKQHSNVVCEDLKDCFFEKGKQEVETLKSAIKLKLVETYSVLEKFICIKNNLDRQSIKIEFVCVTDTPSDDTMLSMSSQKTPLKEFNKSLSRFSNKQDAAQKKYLYDKVTVLPHKAFLALVESGTIPSLP